MMFSKKILLLAGILWATLSGFSQDKNIDKLELLYSQENFGFAAKHAKKLIDNKGYATSPEVHLFLYLSLQEMKDEGWNIPKKYQPIDATIEKHKTLFIALDANSAIRTKYKQYITTENNTAHNHPKKETSTTHKKKIKEVINEEDKIEKDEPVTTSETIAIRKGDSIVNFAKSYLNTPYKYGGTTPKGFDCSGFTCYVLNNNGIETPRSSGEIGKASERIDIKDARKGDLLFFGKSTNNIHHVGIVISNEGEPLTMIHSSTSSGVIITVIEESEYWTKLLRYAGRVVN